MKNKILLGILTTIIIITYSQYVYGLSWTVTQHDNSGCGTNCRWKINNYGSTFTAQVEDDAKYGAGGIVAILNQDLTSTASAIKIGYNVNNVGSCGSGYYPMTYLFVLNKGSICSDPFHDTACISDSNRKEVFRYTSSESQTYYFKYSDGSLKIYTDNSLSNLVKTISLSSLSGDSRYLMFYLYTDNNGCGQPFYAQVSVTDTSEIYSNAQQSPTNQKVKGSPCDVKKPYECPDEAQNCIPYGNVNNRVCLDTSFVTGDEYCWMDGGENAQNSPADCGTIPPCQDECSFSGVRCDVNKIVGCKDIGDSDPCKEKYSIDDCGSKGMVCEGGLCKSKTCYNECDKLGYTCTGNNLYSCDRDEKGCLYLTYLKSCKSSEICSSDRGNCIKNCPNECNFDSYCDGNRYISCGDRNDDGCREANVFTCTNDEVCVRAVGTGYQCQKTTAPPIQPKTITEEKNVQYKSQYPVIFIHGWNGDLGTFNQMQENLKVDKIVDNKSVIYSDSNKADICGNGWDNKAISINFEYYKKKITPKGLQRIEGITEQLSEDAGIEEYAKRLKQAVDLVISCTNSDKVNLVAHSMGGLIARQYMLDNANNVNLLITLATPHYGALFSNFGKDAEEMKPNSPFLNGLNSKDCDNRNKIISLGAKAGFYKDEDPTVVASITSSRLADCNYKGEAWVSSGHDGVVFARSALLLGSNEQSKILSMICSHTEITKPSCQEAYKVVKSILEGNTPLSNVKTDSSVTTTIVTDSPPTEKQQEPFTKEQPQGIGKTIPTQIKEAENIKSKAPQTQKSKEETKTEPRKTEEKQQSNQIVNLFSWFFNIFKR